MTVGRVLQLNISRGGVPKLPIPEAVTGPLGIEGDMHAHPAIHGGPRKALLLICSEAFDELAALGHSVYAGALGENVTMSGIDRRQVRVGQRYRIGEIEVEITKLREPCAQLDPYGGGIQQAIFDAAVKRGDFTSPRWGLAGFYAAVIRSGTLRPGDPIALISDAA